MAAILGVVAALIWSSVLKIIRRVDNSIFCTPAFVCIVYAAAELLGYSGPVATLVFGLVLGNVREIKILQKIPSLQNEMMALTHQEKEFFAALVFFLKSLFFVYVGISMQFDSVLLRPRGACSNGLDDGDATDRDAPGHAFNDVGI